MWSIQRRERSTGRSSRVLRNLHPVMEGIEPRLLLSGTAQITGTTYKDLTGDGSTSNERAEAGVTVELFQANSSTPAATVVSDSKGNYRFENLLPGKYMVQQVVPTGWIETSGLSGHSVTAQNGKTSDDNNFDSFELFPVPTITGLSYTVTTPNGKSTPTTTLAGVLQEGDKVRATFVLAKPEMIELVAYTAISASVNTPDASHEVIFQEQESVTTSSGRQTMVVTVPNGYFAVDLVAGPAIDHLDTNVNISYVAQGRLIDSLQGGSQTNGHGSISGSVLTAPVTGEQTGTGVPGAKVTLTGWSYLGAEVKLTTTSDANGNYTFANLAASNFYGYTISEIPPSGYVQAGNPSDKFIYLFLNTNITSTGKNFIVAPTGQG